MSSSKYYAKYDLETGRVVAVEERPEGILPLDQKPDMSRRWLVASTPDGADKLYAAPDITIELRVPDEVGEDGEPEYIPAKSFSSADLIRVDEWPASAVNTAGLPAGASHTPVLFFLLPDTLPPGISPPDSYILSINNSDARIRPGQILQFTHPGEYILRVTGPWPFQSEPLTIDVTQAPAAQPEEGFDK